MAAPIVEARSAPSSSEPPVSREPPALVQTVANDVSARVALAVPGFRAAVVFVPSGEGPFRLLVATHGAGGDPDSTCLDWAKRAGGRALIACPRGRAVSELEPRGFYYPDHHALEAEVLAVALATEEKYGARLAKTSAVYSGYSQGATMGALFIPPHAARFSALILTEGGTPSGLGRAPTPSIAKAAHACCSCAARGIVRQMPRRAPSSSRASACRLA